MEFSQIQRGSGTEKQGMDMIVTAAKKWYRGVVSPFELIKDNKKYMNDFNNQYNDVIIIDDDYEKRIKNIKWK